MTRKHTNNRMQEKLNNLGVKYGNQGDIRKSRMDKHHGKRSRRTRRRAQNHTKNYIKLESARPWWNTRILVQKIHQYSRQTSTRNEQMSTKRSCIRMDDQRKNHTDPKRPLLKGTAPPNNNRHITCLPIMWKILTAQIREEIYNPLTKAADNSLRNRKDATKDPEAQESYSTLISISSTRARRDGKI